MSAYYSGSPSSVNPPSSCKTSHPPKSITWGVDLSATLFNSLDTLHVGLHFQWPENPLFFDVLDKGKAEAKQNNFKPVPFRIEQSDRFNIHASGKRGGYAWHLSCGDVDLFLSTHEGTGPTPNVFVEIGSISCWNPGYEEIIKSIIQFIESVGGCFLKTRPSRMDLAVDSVGLPFSKTNITDRHRWIKQARDFNLRGSGIDFNSIDIGLGGQFCVRIYDKTEELSTNQVKRDFFHELWGVPLDKEEFHVTRVEFQIRKKGLKELGIKTIADLSDRLSGVWEYCTKKWFRFSSHKVNRTHQADSKIDAWWSIIQSVKWPGTQIVKRTKQTCHKSIHNLLSQAAGLALSVGALHKKTHTEVDSIISIFQHLIDSKIRTLARNGHDFERRIESRLAETWGMEIQQI